MGDFNLNLLNYESHSYTNDFINFMVFHYLIPHILQPTRVTDHSVTVIDNIFSNATDFEATSGNILNQIADHYAQILVLKKYLLSIKIVHITHMITQNLIKINSVMTFLNYLEAKTI